MELDSRVQKDREDGDDRMLNYHIGARDALCEFIRSFIYKYESPAITKTGNPMPEILPGYALKIDSNVYAVLQSNGGGIWFSDYGLRCKLKDKEKIFQIWNRDGVSIWSKE